jgi:signal transduction histidine kinase/ActR/RegA family two-component response regulator
MTISRWWLDRSVRTKGLIVIAIPLLALISTTSTNLVLQRIESHQRGALHVASAVTTSANQLLADAVNAETGIRGYTSTRDPLFLAPYTLALTRLGADQRAVRLAAVSIGAVRQQRLINTSTRTVLVELARLRQAVSNGIFGDNLRRSLEQEKRTMDQLRSQIADLAAVPAAFLVPQRAKISSLESTIEAVDVADLLLGLLAGLLGIALFTSGVSRRVAKNAANAIRLGNGEPLEPVTPSRDEIGSVAAAHVHAQQILADRGAELTGALDSAIKASQAKNDFLSSTSHELRTPLNSILGFAQLLEISALGVDDHDSVERILRAGRHLLALINDLIDFARIESGDLSLSLEPVALEPLVEEIQQLMAPLAAERSITISSRCDSPTLSAHTDRQRLAQVLVNLVSNAIKYNRRGGTIAIRCRSARAGLIDIAVVDTGRGLTPDELVRVFVPFERLTAERSGIEGAGIGLPLAKTLAEAMGGTLRASSELGQGTTFTVGLPSAPNSSLAQAEQPARTSIGRSDRARDARDFRVLYIEDNAAYIELVARFIGSLPLVSLDAATTGRAGIDRAVRDLPDLVLLDLDLDDLDGDAVLAELLSTTMTATIPVVVLSAEASASRTRSLIAEGALAHLTMPLDLGVLGQLLAGFTSGTQVLSQ